MKTKSSLHFAQPCHGSQPPLKPFLRIFLVLLVPITLCLPSGALGWKSTDDPFGWKPAENQRESTHRRVVRQAAELLAVNLDKNSYLQDAAKILEQNMDELLEGSVAADFNPNTPYYMGADMLCKRFRGNCRVSGLFNDHFYDGDSHEGLNLCSVIKYESDIFKGPVGDTPPEHAESQTRRYAGIALATWKDAVLEKEIGNDEEADDLFAEAVYWLGYASHYLSDIFEPHHAANYPLGPLNHSHSEFEALVDKDLDEFLPEDEVTLRDMDYNSTFEYVTLSELITDQANTYASVAKSYLNDCVRKYFRRFPKSWRKAAAEMTRSNRDVLSRLYYRFLQEATLEDSSVDYDSLPVGQFNVEIQMGKGFVPIPRRKHPPEKIRFEIVFRNGQLAIWTLDTSNFYRWYAFNTDAQSSYFLDWGSDLPRPSEVSSIYLTRGAADRGTTWKIENLELFIHGIRVFQIESPMNLEKCGEISIPVENGLQF